MSDLTNDASYTTQTYVDTELAKKQDTLPMGEVTSADIGKALMPKTVSNGEVTSWEFGEAGMVDDITINGTSIVNNKIAEIPIATGSIPGIVKVDTYASGYQGGAATLDGKLYVIGTNLINVKNGIDLSKPIAAGNQHQSAFYGLAKAAGDTTQSQSNNSVGTYTNEAKSAIQTMLGVPAAEDVVTDVQMNGDSIVVNGVANIPIAVSGNLGVVKTFDGNFYGIRGYNGELRIVNAQSGDIKVGWGSYQPITAGIQHQSTFYGLAKAAGADEKDSTLPFGTYTDAAKTAIQSMLGIDTAIANAVGQITGFDFSVVQELPASGVKGVIYLVAHSHGDNDGYDEYIWINNGFEKLGHCDIDLSNYVTFDDYATTSTAGVVKVASTYGIKIQTNGILRIDEATTGLIKIGTDPDHPIVSSNQHASAFYGLAKAAGDSTQSASANAVGTYTDDAKTAIQTMLGVPADDEVVKDVQINGTSIVSNGVANIPIASNNAYGVAKVDSQYGVMISNGYLFASVASGNEIKNGSAVYKPTSANSVDAVAFYGLAKAAGDTTQSALSYGVGTYTDSAKTAIKSMLGVNDGIEVVRLV